MEGDKRTEEPGKAIPNSRSNKIKKGWPSLAFNPDVHSDHTFHNNIYTTKYYNYY